MAVNRSKLAGLLQQHLAWYPNMEVMDAYKLLYQGALGPEHIVATRQEFKRRLEAEFNTLSPTTSERLLEPVRTDGLLFRVNLRPFKAVAIDFEQFVSTLLRTSRSFSGTKTELVDSWSSFVRLCKQGKTTKFPFDEVVDFSQWLEKEDYPPVHHSEAYRHTYQPAYRLISSELLPELGLSYEG